MAFTAKPTNRPNMMYKSFSMATATIVDRLGEEAFINPIDTSIISSSSGSLVERHTLPMMHAARKPLLQPGRLIISHLRLHTLLALPQSGIAPHRTAEIWLGTIFIDRFGHEIVSSKET